MTEPLFVFTAQGVAEAATGYRPGARHALLIFARSATRDAAEARALDFVSGQGWSHAELLRGKEIGSDPSSIADPQLRAAAETARENGAGFVVYRDEIPADS